jgi:hypothetical protein
MPAATYWLKDGKILVDGAGKPILCDHCPCPGPGVVPTCCIGADMPATATLTYTIGAMAPATMSLTKVGHSYEGEVICDVGDGHTQVFLDYASNCFDPGEGWDVSFAISVYVDGVLTAFVIWAPAAFAVGSAPASFSVVCSPYHLHYEGLNTSGNDFLPTVTCGGITYTFTSAAGVIPIVLNVVTP